MRLERDRPWSRVWTCAGRVSDIPMPGNFFRYDLGTESFIVTRGHDRVIRAFHNACQHRGRRLVDADFGTRLRFVCPFHSWSYDLTGRNTQVTDRMRFLPHPSDPEKFVYHVHIIIPKLPDGVRLPFYMGVADDVDFSGRTRPKRQYTTQDDPQTGEVLDQDIANLRAVQLGQHSRGIPRRQPLRRAGAPDPGAACGAGSVN
jgi:nitrite reductase/ring-hydroxylating ferredoxin subunit